MKDFCDTHAYDFHGLPIDECPICVREERDRYRKALEDIFSETKKLEISTADIYDTAREALEVK